MTSPSLLILLTKIALIADMAAIIAFVLDYSRLAPWWRNPVGRTIVLKDLFLLAVISLIVASVFFQFSRFTSEVASWIQVALLGGMALAMLWRIVVFERIHRHEPEQTRDLKGEADDGEPGRD